MALLLVIDLLAGPARPGFAEGASTTAAATSAASTGQGIYVIDVKQHSVLLFPGNGQSPITIAAGLTDPEELAVDAYNNVYVIDRGTGELTVIDHRTGVTTILLTDNSWQAGGMTMALDARGNLFVLDQFSILTFAAVTHARSPLGTTVVRGKLTVDAVGNISITGYRAVEPYDLVSERLPSSGGAPTFRTLAPDDQGWQFLESSETPGGTVYFSIEAPSSYASENVQRLLPGSAVDDQINTRYAYYAHAIDRSGNFYLMQSRTWCEGYLLGSGQCKDDFAVDSILKFAPAGGRSARRPVSHVVLPFGGMAVDDSGNVYAADQVFVYEPYALNPPTDQLVRIDATSGVSTVMAKGSFLMPTLAATAPLAPTAPRAAHLDWTRAVLSWAAPRTTGGSPITGYRVSRNGTDSKGTGAWSTVVPATTSTFTFGNLKPGTQYTLSVSAINAIGTGPAAEATVRNPAVTTG